MFEICLVERDYKGNPTGKWLEFQSDKPYEIWSFWEKNRPAKKKNKTKAATASEAQKIINTLNQRGS